MVKRAYQYDEDALTWYECEDADFLDKDIAELPLGFIVAWEPREQNISARCRMAKQERY